MADNYLLSFREWIMAGMFLTAFFCNEPNLKAQTAPAISWNRSIGGSVGDNLTSFQQTADGGYILGGNSASGISGDKSQAHFGNGDCWIVKTDANGNKIWDKTFGGSAYDILVAVKQTSDGGYILGCYSNSPVSGNKTTPYRGGGYDYWIVKTDASGNKLWEKTFGDTGWDQLAALLPTSDGGFLLGGYSDSPMSANKSQASKGSSDYWLVKIDSNGNKDWDKTLGGSNGDYLTNMKAAPGGFILGGYSGSNISGDKTQGIQGSWDYWVIKVNPGGIKIWDKTFGGPQEDRLREVLPTSDGGYLIGGNSYSNTGGDKTSPSKGYIDAWVLKLDGLGNKVWDQAYGGQGEEWLDDITESSAGGYVLAGSSSSGISGDKSETCRGGRDYWVLKINNAGNKIWDKTMGGDHYDEASCFLQASDGGYLIGGTSETYQNGEKTASSQGDRDIWIVKLAAEVTGTSEMQLSAPVTIQPNPNSGKFFLTAESFPYSNSQIIITDLLGREVMKKEIVASKGFLKEPLELRTKPGIYLLTVKSGNHSMVRKIVIE